LILGKWEICGYALEVNKLKGFRNIKLTTVLITMELVLWERGTIS